jgi:antitoxin component of MazEF toxin-antitoxin module
MKTSKEIKVFKSGNSLAIRIPKQIADLYHLTQKSKLILIPKDDKLILEIAGS